MINWIDKKDEIIPFEEFLLFYAQYEDSFEIIYGRYKKFSISPIDPTYFIWQIVNSTGIPIPINADKITHWARINLP